MNFVRCVPPILSTLLLGAHFLRAQNGLAVALVAALPLLLLVRKPWVPGVYSGVLILGAVEWLRTLASIADVRRAAGEPWMRMAIILGAVALVTAGSSLVFLLRPMRRRYGI